ncbi:type I restriction enzyme HsdR N-terminal domain-containing protein [Portibacter lacus]|uniref:Restriction endonuclease subunit R n=1 Tax=Portibacter lacus TaxID=1099794 RepID=A0AA37SQZ8_9BACT|nr:type I restriction enzyme HsdR N-terminal domain-containing protein [Portibacter lacus]GLR18362.1 restriction endonuclease subunit R [Portibacter lacus]
MSQIDLLKYSQEVKISKVEGKSYIYDVIRKKDIVLQPEELVRQCAVLYLIHELEISKNLIRVEKGIKVNGLFRRCDIIVYDRNGIPLLIVECKRPNQAVNQKVFNQIAMYNIPLQVPYLMLTNGSTNYFCSINFEESNYKFLEELPKYEKLNGKS